MAVCRLLLTVACPTTILTVIFLSCTDSTTTEIYTLSLHDALPIWAPMIELQPRLRTAALYFLAESLNCLVVGAGTRSQRSEEHTSELQSRLHLVCRLLLEKKK